VSTKVAYLTPLLYGQPLAGNRGVEFLLALARGVIQASHHSWDVELISFGEAARNEMLETGLSLRFLPAAKAPLVPWDVLSWELPRALDDAAVLHIFDIHTRSGEMALLVAKLQRKPVCVSDLGHVSSTLGKDLQIAELADQVIDLAEWGVAPGRHPQDAGFLATGGRLLDLYQDLVLRAKGMAA
jgi:hypothetical protein